MKLIIVVVVVSLVAPLLAVPAQPLRDFEEENLGFKRIAKIVEESAAKNDDRSQTGKLNPKNAHTNQFFEQVLDHFDDQQTGTWQQRYHYNDEFRKPGGPAFLFFGGEGALSEGFVQVELDYIKKARQVGAIVFALEHRYYGRSQPVDETDQPEMKYLSSKQALADAANFIKGMRQKFDLTDAKWVAFGGSYPGMLAAWFRQNYPDVVVGAVASSAPVEATLDFKYYFDTAGQSFRDMDRRCYDDIKSSFSTMDRLMNTTAGRVEVAEKLNICDKDHFPELSGSDLGFFGFYATVFVAAVVQNHRPYAPSNIFTLCDQFHSAESDDPLLKLRHVYDSSLGSGCFGYTKFSQQVEQLHARSDARSWNYQKCTEFGFFKTGDDTDHPFSKIDQLEWFLTRCKQVFNLDSETVMKAIKDTHDFYGGREGFKGTNVAIPHGSLDPWHSLGILKDPNPTAEVLIIPGAAHVWDVYADRSDDPEQLVRARLATTKYVKKWLQL